MDSDEQAIRKLIETWLTATRAGDTKTVLSLMAEDVVFLVPGQPPMRGKSAFAASQDAMKDFSIEANSQVQEIKVMGDDRIRISWSGESVSALKVVAHQISPMRRSRSAKRGSERSGSSIGSTLIKAMKPERSS